MSDNTKNEHYGYCDACNGPVIPRSQLYMALSWTCYWVWMRLPQRLALGWLGFKLLPRVGDIGYTCTCRDKLDQAIAAKRAGLGAAQ